MPNGPFTNNEVSIYCDESRHEGQSHQPFMGSHGRQEKKRIFVTLGKEVIYFISLVYTEHGLALGTAFPPDSQWLRKMQSNSTLLGP